MSFSQALSGLRGQAENIKVISNNIANSQTVGFKTGNLLFADVFAGAGNVGLGVDVVGVMQDFRSGDLQNTGRNLDLAIGGKGFYRLEKPNGEVVYSRNGQFNQDREGFLVSSTGQFLTGYGLTDANDPFSDVIAGGAPVRLQIPPNDMPAQATGEDGGASVIYNLDATTGIHDPGAAPPIRDPNIQRTNVITDPATGATAEIEFHFSSSYTVYDSLGNERVITSYFTKSDVNTWDVEMAFDGFRDLADIGIPDVTLGFDEDGQLDLTGIPITPITAGGGGIGVVVNAVNPEAVNLTFTGANFDLGGAADLAFNLDFAGTTQFNNNSVMNLFQQDGYTSGTLIGVEVDKDGTVIRIFTNEQREAAGQVVLTNFLNPEGLQPDGDNGWRQTMDSGEPILGEAGTGVFGTIVGGVLENSNVDLAQELVNMIVAQRAYQANSSSIGTQDEMLQTVINL